MCLFDRFFLIFAFAADTNRVPATLVQLGWHHRAPNPTALDNNQARERVLAMHHDAFNMLVKRAPYWNGNTANCVAGVLNGRELALNL